MGNFTLNEMSAGQQEQTAVATKAETMEQKMNIDDVLQVKYILDMMVNAKTTFTTYQTTNLLRQCLNCFTQQAIILFFYIMNQEGSKRIFTVLKAQLLLLA